MDTRELLTQLEKLEYGLDSFSFTELKSSEASRLKKSFESFKIGLEEKVFGMPGGPVESQKTTAGYDQVATESKLIANVSHEIRTPLNGIIGFLDLLKETPLSHHQNELVNAMDGASKNLLGLINQLLEFSSLASGQEKFERVPFNPANLINEVAFLCKTLINGKSVALLVNYDERIPKNLLGDPSKLSQVLLNLVGNAVKFVEEGEIQLEVNLKEEKSKRLFLEFIISDTGVGIANENLKHIFESYKQAEPSTKLKYGGSGLGLSIVKEIIEKQHGCIAVSSALGIGTTFKVVLPFDKVASVPAPSDPKNLEDNFDISKKAILVFEDDALTQRLMRNRLEQWGCKPYIAENEVYGLQLLKNHNIDLVLLDMHLPGSNGLEIVKRIRKSKEYANLPIIILSGDAYSHKEDVFHDLEINDFILKPYNSDELREKIYTNSQHRNREVAHTASKKEQRTAGTKPIDLDPLLQECLGKTELLDELVRLFEQNILEFIGKTKMYLQSGNLQGVGFAAHKIKSCLKMLHANRLIGICEEMILECRTTNNIEHLKGLFEDFVGEYPKIEKAMEEEIRRIKHEL